MMLVFVVVLKSVINIPFTAQLWALLKRQCGQL